MIMVQYLQTQEQKDHLIKVFQKLDTNNDGVISREELLDGYSTIMHQPDAESFVDRIL